MTAPTAAGRSANHPERTTVSLHTFTRPQLAAALEAAGHPWIAEGLYSAQPYEARMGRRVLALDFDDPGDLGIFLIVTSALLPEHLRVEFGRSLVTGTPGHPDGSSSSGIRGAQWGGFELAEPTGDEWADDMRDCGGCAREDATDIECPYHATAPWDVRAPVASAGA